MLKVKTKMSSISNLNFETIADKKELTFMLTDIDYKIEDNDESPTIRLFGKTPTENIMISISDFLPYFYVTYTKDLEFFINNDAIISEWKKRIELTKKKRYLGGKEVKVLKISGSHPEKTQKIREKFQEAGYEIHEADIPFVKRFLIDTSLRCLTVITTSVNITSSSDKMIIAETSYRVIKTADKSKFPVADYFYRLKLMAFDIEVDHQDETIQQLTGEVKKRITAISAVFGTSPYEKQEKIFILTDDSDQEEINLIQKFIDLLQKIQPDVLITFNGDNFDLPYLLERMNKLSIDSRLLSQFQNDSVFYSNRYRTFRIKGRISYDISPRTWSIHPISGKKGLGDIAETVLGEGKINVDMPLGELWRSGYLNGNRTNQKLLKDYALRDSKLTYELTWKLGVQGWLEIIRLTGYPAGEAPGSTERIFGEFELMRFCYQKDVLIPLAPSDEEVNRRREERRKNPHKGGTVLVPKGTLHVGVIITDFRSMYPSVCVAHNIGGETLKRLKEIEKIEPLNMFHDKPQSCLSSMQETLIKRREITKQKIKELKLQLEKNLKTDNKQLLQEEIEILDKEQYSMKIVANSMYGSHNYIRSRFYSIQLGNAITDIARTYILRMEKWLEEVSKKVTPCSIIYGDTDSAFIKLHNEELVTKAYLETIESEKRKSFDNLLKIVNDILSELNSKIPEAMELSLEDIAFKLIFKPGRAKAYSYFSLLTNELNITGFEAVRSDWSQLSRDAQRKVLTLILTEPSISKKIDSSKRKTEDPGIKKAKEYLIQLGVKMLKTPTKELIPKAVILSPIKKPPSRYKSKVPAVQAFLDFARRENLDPEVVWKEYDKFQWVIVPGKGIISDRARHPKYANDLDRDYYINEVLRSSESFGIDVSLQDVKNVSTTEPLDEILKRLPSKTTSEEKDEEKITAQNKTVRTKQTKLGKYFEDP
ncbi:MAG: hypothetical protein FK734_13595 [Asgard group archaeon]|nr:hypothetical protein [Asgard group archaeon]